MSGSTYCRLAVLAVLVTILLGGKWPPAAIAQQQGVSLAAVDEHLKYEDKRLDGIDEKIQQNAIMISELKDLQRDTKTWQAVVDGQLILIRYGIGILVAIFGGQLGIKWADSRRSSVGSSERAG